MPLLYLLLPFSALASCVGVSPRSRLCAARSQHKFIALTQEARTAQGTALLRQKQLGQLCHQYQRRYKTGASCFLEGAKGGDRERSGWKEGVCNGSKIMRSVVPLSQDCDFCSLVQGVSSPALLTLLLWPRGTCYVALFPGGQQEDAETSLRINQDADSHPS